MLFTYVCSTYRYLSGTGIDKIINIVKNRFPQQPSKSSVIDWLIRIRISLIYLNRSGSDFDSHHENFTEDFFAVSMSLKQEISCTVHNCFLIHKINTGTPGTGFTLDKGLSTLSYFKHILCYLHFFKEFCFHSNKVVGNTDQGTRTDGQN